MLHLVFSYETIVMSMNHEKISHSVTQCPVKLMIFFGEVNGSQALKGVMLSLLIEFIHKKMVSNLHLLSSLKLTTLQHFFKLNKVLLSSFPKDQYAPQDCTV